MNASKSFRNFSHTFRYSGSTLKAMSDVIIIRAFIWPGMCASGVLGASGSVGVHCSAPAGLLTCFHSYLKRLVR